MTTKAAELALRAPATAYFAADTTGADAVGHCFTHSGLVIDERQEYLGRTMTQGFDRVVKKLDEPIQRLHGAGFAIASITRSVDVGVNYHDSGVPQRDNFLRSV